MRVTADFDNLSRSGMCWGDYDDDGDLDLAIAGSVHPMYEKCSIYRNDDGDFVEIDVGLHGVWDASAEWGDYDNDGDLDIIIAGVDLWLFPWAIIYRNDGNDTFVDIDAGIRGMSVGATRWGDYDNDGDLDLIVVGLAGGHSPDCLPAIYRNDGSDTFVRTPIELEEIDRGFAEWGDYDNDGDLDIITQGVDSHWPTEDTVKTVLYRNDGSDVFTQFDDGLYDLRLGESRWGDYDQDGDLDILIVGNDISQVGHSFVYRNDGTFIDIDATIDDAPYGSIAWGDCDNDGDLDIVVSGVSTDSSDTTIIYRYDGNSTFTDLGAEIDIQPSGPLCWGDFDNDGDLDLIGGGYTGTSLYRNDGASANTPPTAPDGLGSLAFGSRVRLSWETASDNETQSTGLTYNVRIGSSPGGVDILSPMADPVTGYRKVAAFGNAFQNRSWTIYDLPDGTYYWSVQAIDNAFAGSEFAPEQSFTIPGDDYVCGDVDYSIAVDIDDAVYLMEFIFASPPEPVPLESGDTDCSGVIDIDDLVWIAAYIFSGGSVPCDTDGDGVPDC